MVIAPEQDKAWSRQRVVELSMRTLLPLVGVLIMMSGMLTVLIFALVPLVEHVRTQNWHTHSATVERYTVTEQGSGLARFFAAERIRYRYTVEGQDYTSHSGNLHQGVISDLRAVQNTPTAGERITVWVHPTQPELAVANRKLDWGLVALAVPGLALSVIGALMVFFGMLSWSGERRTMPPPTL